MTLNTVGLVVATTLAVCIGCSAPDTESCEYWEDQFTKGKKEAEAITRIGELKCTAAAEALAEAFPESVYREETVRAIGSMGQTDAGVAIVKQGLNDREVGPLAIAVARRWRVQGLQGMLQSIIRAERNAVTRKPSLEALLDLTSPEFTVIGKNRNDNGAVIYELNTDDDVEITIQHVQSDKGDTCETEGGAITIKGDFAKGYPAKTLAHDVTSHPICSFLVRAKHGGDGVGNAQLSTGKATLIRRITDIDVIETLIWTVGQDPALQRVETNQYAAEMLEYVDWIALRSHERYAALVDEATQNLIKALFAKDNRGNAAQLQARLALRSIGPIAAPRLMEAFEGKNQDLSRFIEVRGLPEWKTNMGPELVEMLWDVGNRDASKILMCAIGRSLDPPPDVARLEPDDRTEWNQANNNRLTTTAFAVGALTNDDAVSCATDLLKTNEEIDVSQFKNAGLALGLMGSKKSETALWQLFTANDEKIKGLEAKVSSLQSRLKSAGGEAKKKLRKEGRATEKELDQLNDKKANFVVNLAVGFSPQSAGRFKAAVLDVKTGPIAESAKQPLPLAYHDLVTECGSDASKYIAFLQGYRGQNADKKKKLTALVEEVKDAQKAKQKAGEDKNTQMKDWWKERVADGCKAGASKGCISKATTACGNDAATQCKGERRKAKRKACEAKAKETCVAQKSLACKASVKADKACTDKGEQAWLAKTQKHCAEITPSTCASKSAKKCAKKRKKKCGDDDKCAFDLDTCQKDGVASCTKSYPGKCLTSQKSLNGQINAAGKHRNMLAKELKTIGKLHTQLSEAKCGSEALKKKHGDLATQFQLDSKHGQAKATWTSKTKPCKQRLAEYYNWRVNDYNAAIEQVEGLWKIVDGLDAQFLKPADAKLTATIRKLHKLEKAVLVLGGEHVGDAQIDTALPLICDLFLDANPEYFSQFRYWALVYLEHVAQAKHIEKLETLYKKELDQSPRGGTFWTLRLQSLVKRLQLQ